MNFVVCLYFKRTKRKFVDVNKRLENLYDCLRDGRVSCALLRFI